MDQNLPHMMDKVRTLKKNVCIDVLLTKIPGGLIASSPMMEGSSDWKQNHSKTGHFYLIFLCNNFASNGKQANQIGF